MSQATVRCCCCGCDFCCCGCWRLLLSLRRSRCRGIRLIRFRATTRSTTYTQRACCWDDTHTRTALCCWRVGHRVRGRLASSVGRSVSHQLHSSWSKRAHCADTFPNHPSDHKRLLQLLLQLPLSFTFHATHHDLSTTS